MRDVQVFVVAVLLAHSAAQKEPVQVQWSTRSYGPDGPWNALSLLIGSNSQPIDLLPGGLLNSQVFGSGVCDTTSATCYAQQAGLYDPAASSNSTFVTTNTGTSLLPSLYQFPLSAEGNTTVYLDSLSFGNRNEVALSNQTFFDIDPVYNVLPNGTQYPVTIGTYGLGGPPVDHATLEGTPHGMGNPPSQLYFTNVTASSSFGMHIGSVNPPIMGSLYYGGYDQSRIIGTINSQPYLLNGQSTSSGGGPWSTFIDLLDISLQVASDRGPSPFSPSAISGLLKAGSDPFITVRPAGSTPYLHLPKDTCDALAAQLPVTYNKDFNIYTWNVEDPQYERIVSSPSFMSFSFRSAQGGNLTINVPFMLLNLTLTPPLTAEPTPYFPCYPSSGTAVQPYYLGRAFMQAAFYGVNFQADNPPGNWWLAQAPGPNTASNPLVVTINPLDRNIQAASVTSDWASTWDGYWKPLPEDTKAPPTSQPTATATPSGGSGGLSSGVSAGIGVGVTVAVLLVLCIVAGLLLMIRKRKQQKKKHGDSGSDTEGALAGAGEEPKGDPSASTPSNRSNNRNLSVSSPTDNSQSQPSSRMHSTPGDSSRNQSIPNISSVSTPPANSRENEAPRYELGEGMPRHEIADPSGEGDARHELAQGVERHELGHGMDPQLYPGDGSKGPPIGSAANPAETAGDGEKIISRHELPTSADQWPLATSPASVLERRKQDPLNDDINDIAGRDRAFSSPNTDIVSALTERDAQRIPPNVPEPLSENEKRRMQAKYNGTS